MHVGTIDGRYRVEVEQEGDGYRGHVQVVDEQTGEVIARQETAISYGAPFGPDYEDVQEWGIWATDVVDHLEARGKA